MKTFTFKYNPSEPKLSSRIKDATSGKPYVRPNELVSTSLKAMFQLATEARLELFEAIVRLKPSSVYALAEQIGKSQPYILKEVRTLESIGLIQLIKELDGNREKLRPVALYSNIVIDCGFDSTQKEAS